jgi:prepilin-type N-terminal cleavage/methylation domain-containing protein
MKRKGFTLVELMVVVIIIGILTTMAVPLYRKTIETSKATDALSILNMIANANRMYQLDTGNYANGQISSSHVLVANKYIADHPWSNYQWVFCACNGTNCGSCRGGCSGSSRIACAYNNSPVGVPYTLWRYEIGMAGECYSYGTNVPPCPKL